MSVVNEVITKFSFIGNLKPQDTFNGNLKVSVSLLAGFGAAIKTSTAGMFVWVNSVTQSIDPMVQLSRETGETISSIQELGYAASQNGSSLDSVMSSIKELTKRSGEFARTGGGPAAEAMLQLGLNVRDSNGDVKKSSDLMMELRGSLKNFDSAQQADILDKLGIDPSMIQLLNQSASSIDSLREKARSLGTITKEQGDAAASLNDSYTTLRFGLQGLQNQIAVGMAPVIQGATNDFIDFLSANKDLIKNGIKSLGIAIVEISAFMNRMLPVAAAAAAAFVVWKVATLGLAGAFSLLFSPVTLITAAIVGVALVIDDLIVAFRGGSSVIKDFILDWTGFDITAGLQAGVQAIKDFVNQAMGMLSALKDYVSGIFSGIADSLSFSMPTTDDVKGFFGFDTPDEAFDSGVGSSSSSVSVTQGNNINIYTSDPVAAGGAAAEAIDRDLKQTRQYYDRGGM